MAEAPASAAVGKGKRKRPISEDDVYLLLHRYPPGTILTALQEVAQHAEGRRIDWKAVVRKSATGITSAREYQMLWRHFAYHHELDETIGARDPPLGDDSDLECEIEPVPIPTKEALSEASALAKVLISGSSREQASGHRANLEAPVQNSGNEKIVRVPSEKQLAQSHRLSNVSGPTSNSKQTSLDPLDANGPHNKKKKKPKAWSKEEDADLAAGVMKYGEGKWQDILDKCNFDTSRTPVHLSQRWAVISKRPGGSSSKLAMAKPVSVARSEERKAALEAFTMAVGRAPVRKKPMLTSGGLQQSCQRASTVFGSTIPEVKPVPAPSVSVPVPVPVPVPIPMQVPVAMPVPVAVQVQSPHPHGQVPAQDAPKVSNAMNKTRNNTKKQAAQQNQAISHSSIQAAALAAGGRLATPSTAANFLKVAQSKNAVHIRSRGTGPSKSSTSSKASLMVVEPGTLLGSVQHLEPPSTSAAIPGPAILTTHTTEQVHSVPEVGAVNPPGPSARAHLLETKKILSTSPVLVSCDSDEKDDDSDFCVVTMDDLFPEDAKQPEAVNPKAERSETVSPTAKQPEAVSPKAKQPETVGPKAKQIDSVEPQVEEVVDSKDADMIEFDRFVAAQGACSSVDYLDKSKTVRSAPGAQGFAGCQKKQLQPVPAAGKNNPLSVAVPAAGKNNSLSVAVPAAGKAKTLVPHSATPMQMGTLHVAVGVGNDAAQNRTIGRKAAAPAATGVLTPPLKKPVTSIARGNQMPSNAMVGSVAPASSQASTMVNGASKANQPANRQGNIVVNLASKVNPPASSQASRVVNGARKVNPPASSLASTVANGASKVNPPARQ